MAKTKDVVPCMTSIGETAGAIWLKLSEKGPMTMAQMIKAIGGQRDTVILGLGWLARENKINIEERGRSRIVSLC